MTKTPSNTHQFQLNDLLITDSTPAIDSNTEQQKALEAEFKNYTNVASTAKNASVFMCSDESFGECKCLISDELPQFKPTKFFEYGNWMDGWETKRHNAEEHDWAIIKLSGKFRIRGVDVDTRHFNGNHAPYASLEAADGSLVLENLDDGLNHYKSLKWTTLVEKSPLAPTSSNLFKVDVENKFNFIRLKNYPDGGIARLRVYTDDYVSENEKLTAYSLSENGGSIVFSSNSRYSKPENILATEPGSLVKDGWETRRRRVPLSKSSTKTLSLWDVFECCIVKLGQPSTIEKIELDTSKFKFNSPKFVQVLATADDVDTDHLENSKWSVVAQKQLICKDTSNWLSIVPNENKFKYTLLKIFPDGGVMRFKVYGKGQDEAHSNGQANQIVSDENTKKPKV